MSRGWANVALGAALRELALSLPALPSLAHGCLLMTTVIASTAQAGRKGSANCGLQAKHNLPLTF